MAEAIGASAPGSFSLQGVHAQYSDAGLLALLLSTGAGTAGAHITAMAQALAATLEGVTDAEVARAK